MMISILMIYSIIMCWWCYSWVRNNIKLKIKTNKQLVINILIVSMFFFVFVFFIRLLNLFREYKTLDLNSINMNFGFSILFVCFILLYSVRRLLLFFFKLTWFRLHYFLLSPYNLPKVYKVYSNFYFDFLYVPLVKMYKYLKFLRIVITLGLIFFLFKDLICNNFVLDKSLLYFRYYSVFIIIYLVSKFTNQKQDLVLDYYFQNMLYTLDSDHPFQYIKCSKHLEIVEMAYDYKNNMIFEYDLYVAKKINYTDNEYYRYLTQGNIFLKNVRIVSIEEMFNIKKN